jgi:hypothetical protein
MEAIRCGRRWRGFRLSVLIGNVGTIACLQLASETTVLVFVPSGSDASEESTLQSGSRFDLNIAHGRSRPAASPHQVSPSVREKS